MMIAPIVISGLVAWIIYLYATARTRAQNRAYQEEAEALRSAAMHTAYVLGWLKDPAKYEREQGLDRPQAQEPAPAMPDLFTLHRPDLWVRSPN